LLREALAGLPTPCARRYRAIAAATATFEGGWRKQLLLLAERRPVEMPEETDS
jgi:hypothetical protein